MEIKQFLLVLRRRWPSVVLVFLVGIGTDAVASLLITPQYESTARVFLTIDASAANRPRAEAQVLNTSAQSYADLARSSDLAEQVLGVLELDLSPAELSRKISSEVIDETTLIAITVTDSDPRRAQRIAEVVTDEFQTYAEALETPGEGEPSQIAVRLTDAATYDPDPVEPRTLLNLFAGGLIGLLLGMALAMARELLDRTVRTADHISELTGAPVLAIVGFDPDIRSVPLLTDLGAFAERTEAFRLLRTNLQYIDLDQQARVLVVTSAVPGEGKTMTSANLAIALAQTGQTVLAIDADLSRPRLATAFGVDPDVGLTTALVGEVAAEDVVQVHEASGVHVLASGAKPPNPTEILQSQVTRDLIHRLRRTYDMIVIDAPPVLAVTDASVLSTLSEGTILVVRHGHTTRDQVADAVGRLHQAGGRLDGVVVNMAARRAIASYYSYFEETRPVVTEKNRPGRRAKS